MHNPPRILVVDDEPFNVDYLEQELEDYGYDIVTAFNGKEALEQVQAQNPDIVLLDIMMPILDGFSVLEKMKAQDQWRDIPVVIISAMDDIDSVVRGIELGADDYLPKPFNEILLEARIKAGLERKRLRDNEREYFEQVQTLTDAALAVENDTFELVSIDDVAQREDELGGLARVFQSMALRVHHREQQLRHQIEQLQSDIIEQNTETTDLLAHYVPMDQRHALANNISLSEETEGVALFIDVSGYTRLAQAFVTEFGEKRGAEEMIRSINHVYNDLIDEIHQYSGSVIGFAGDSLTCWYDISTGNMDILMRRALATAKALQNAMLSYQNIVVGASFPVNLSIKVAISSGSVRRFLAGDPEMQVFDIIAGNTVTDLAIAESLAKSGDIVLTSTIYNHLADSLEIEAHTNTEADKHFVTIKAIHVETEPAPWEPLRHEILKDENLFQQWLHPAVYEHVKAGKSANLAQFRETASLFLTFSGIDYEYDPLSSAQLDQFVRWVQQVVDAHQGKVVQVTVGDKNNYIFVVFGAPIALENHALSAVKASLMLIDNIPFETPVHDIRIGIASGTMRSGAYGSAHRRTYGNQGPQTNLAARLMMVADSILVDETIYSLTSYDVLYEHLDPIMVKSYARPIKIYCPVEVHPHLVTDFRATVDMLSPDEQSILRVMSVFNAMIKLEILEAIHPDNHSLATIQRLLRPLRDQNLIIWNADDHKLMLSHPELQRVLYEAMLFAQRRQLHRAIATWYEETLYDEIEMHFDVLIYHWDRAEDFERTLEYLERAADYARDRNDIEQARAYYEESLKRRSQD